jgi:hypothetical protein
MIKESKGILHLLGKSYNREFKLTLANTIQGNILLKEMSLKSGATHEEYSKKFSENPAEVLEEFFLLDYDEKASDYGDITKRVFKFLINVFELPEDFDFSTVNSNFIINCFEKAKDWALAKNSESFMPTSDTTSASITGQ